MGRRRQLRAKHEAVLSIRRAYIDDSDQENKPPSHVDLASFAKNGKNGIFSANAARPSSSRDTPFDHCVRPPNPAAGLEEEGLEDDISELEITIDLDSDDENESVKTPPSDIRSDEEEGDLTADNLPFQPILTQRLNDGVVYNNHTFYDETPKVPVTKGPYVGLLTLRCSTYHVKGHCTAKLTMKPDKTQPKRIGRHMPFCIPNETTAAKKMFRTKLLEGAKKKTPHQPMKQFFHETLTTFQVENELTQHQAAAMHTYLSQRSSLHRAKRLLTKMPLPKTPWELEMPESLKLTETGERFFLLKDDQLGYVIWTTEQMLRTAATADTFQADGTFKTVPPGYIQLFTFQSCVDKMLVPAAYVLMTGRTQQHYKRVMQDIAAAVTQYEDERGNPICLRPRTIIMDFEIAPRKVMKEIFPEAEIVGCYFHFAHCIMGKISVFRLRREYSEPGHIKNALRLLYAVPFAPVHRVREAYNYCKSKINIRSTRDLHRMFAYYYQTWINRAPTSERQHASFNMFGRQHRTNNALESFHRQLNREIRPHPDIFTFAQYLQKVEKAIRTEQMQQERGELVRRPQVTKRAKLNEKLNRLRNNFQSGIISFHQYLDHVSDALRQDDGITDIS